MRRHSYAVPCVHECRVCGRLIEEHPSLEDGSCPWSFPHEEIPDRCDNAGCEATMFCVVCDEPYLVAPIPAMPDVCSEDCQRINTALLAGSFISETFRGFCENLVALQIQGRALFVEDEP